MQILLTYFQVLFSGALSLHAATGLNAKLCLGLEILFFLLLFLGSAGRCPRPQKAQLALLAIRAWLTASLAMMFASYGLLALNFR